MELADGTWRRLNPPFPPGTSKAYAKERALYWQQKTDERGLESVPKATKAAPEQETVSQWFERWTTQREAEGVACVPDDRGRFRTHVESVIGDRIMTKITNADIDDVVDALNDKVTRKVISWRTAGNVWGVVSKMFTDAVRKKGFRRLAANPCEQCEPPKRGEEKAFTYLYPKEFAQLISEPTVPLLWRRMIAVSVFLGVRSSELTALRCGDVDLEHGIVSVRRSLKRNRKHQGETKAPKAGRAKKVPIPANLRPLLDVLTDGRDDAENPLSLPEDHGTFRQAPGLHAARWARPTGVAPIERSRNGAPMARPTRHDRDLACHRRRRHEGDQGASPSCHGEDEREVHPRGRAIR